MTAAHTVSATPNAYADIQGGMKIAGVSITLSTSYATGGSAVDFSTAGPLGVLGFQTVTAVTFGGHETAASSKYYCCFIPAAANAAATGLIKVHDTSAGSDAEVSSTTDLHASLIRCTVYGT